jgi:hypothetical protein
VQVQVEVVLQLAVAGRGGAPAVDDEAVTLALFSQWSRFASERDFDRYADRWLRGAFPRLPHRSQVNRQIRHERETIVAVGHAVAERLGAEVEYEALDTTAAPVRNARGEVIAAVSVAGPTMRVNGDTLRRFFRASVVQAADAISDQLGWPLFAKDTIKAALMSVLPVADVDDARRLGRAAVEVLLAVAAEVTGGAVLEAVWRRDQVVTRCPASLEPWWRSSVDVIGRRWRRGTQRDADLPDTSPNTKTPQSYGVLRPSSPWPADGRSSRSIPLARSIPSPSPTK